MFDWLSRIINSKPNETIEPSEEEKKRSDDGFVNQALIFPSANDALNPNSSSNNTDAGSSDGGGGGGGGEWLPLPDGFTPKAVSIQKNGSLIWTQAVSTTENTLVNKQTIQGVARGCSPNSIAVGETLELHILVSAENSETEISTLAKLAIVYWGKKKSLHQEN